MPKPSSMLYDVQPYHISQNRNVYFNKLQFISSNFDQTLACMFGMQIKQNKSLYGALTRWGYTNTRITVHDTYSTQLYITAKNRFLISRKKKLVSRIIF
jgi:hypothetical protein